MFTLRLLSALESWQIKIVLDFLCQWNTSARKGKEIRVRKNGRNKFITISKPCHQSVSSRFIIRLLSHLVVTRKTIEMKKFKTTPFVVCMD